MLTTVQLACIVMSKSGVPLANFGAQMSTGALLFPFWSIVLVLETNYWYEDINVLYIYNYIYSTGNYKTTNRYALMFLNRVGHM